jgi:hypothetical protein
MKTRIAVRGWWGAVVLGAALLAPQALAQTCAEKCALAAAPAAQACANKCSQKGKECADTCSKKFTDKNNKCVKKCPKGGKGYSTGGGHVEGDGHDH